MQLKKVLAVIMSLCMVAGAVSYGAPVISQMITAQAEEAEEECCSFDEETGVLTLRGEVDVNAVKRYKKSNVKSVIAEEGTVFPEDCTGLFGEFKECTYMDLSNVDTSKVTNMSGMFYNCVALTSLDVSSFDTSNVIDMAGMFSDCSGLTSLDLTHFNTEKVYDMHVMFSGCSGLTELDVSGFNTSNVTSMDGMDGMFYGCSGLTLLDVSSFDTSNVTSMDGMFGGCSGLTSLDVSNFDTSNVKEMGAMFATCTGLTELDLSNFDTSNVTNMNYMFSGCSNLRTLDLRNFDTSNIVVNDNGTKRMEEVFTDCAALNNLTLGEKFDVIPAEAELSQGSGWVNVKDPDTIISGNGDYAVIENEGKNTYVQYGTNMSTCPTKIKVEYNEKYHQVRFKWNKVYGADRYGIAVYLTGKWRIQTQDITDTVYTTPKNLVPNKTYKVAIAARVNGKWDTKNAIRNAVTITVK